MFAFSSSDRGTRGAAVAPTVSPADREAAEGTCTCGPSVSIKSVNSDLGQHVLEYSCHGTSVEKP